MKKSLAAFSVAASIALAGCAVEETGGGGAGGGGSNGKGNAAKSDMTVNQENAVGSAENYLNMTPFSKSGLIDQLKFEEYSQKDATFAVNRLNVNWNKQAAKSAENYLDMSSFSRSGLIDQLKFEGYTQEQAEFGVNQTGLR